MGFSIFNKIFYQKHQINKIFYYICITNDKTPIMDFTKISNVEVEGIDTKDYPDFCDAHITYAEIDGVALNDEQLDYLNEQRPDIVHEKVFEKLF